jgi:hypothetical protein
MESSVEIDNVKYKLLGFEKNQNLVIIMVISTGKIIKVRINEILRSEIIDDLSKAETRDIYRKYYSGGAALTTYEINDRHEKSWMAYVALNLTLFALYIFTNIAATKLVYIASLDITITPGVFIYPLTFLVVDILNESYGLRLARRAILFAFASNAFILILLTGTSYLPGLSGWRLDTPYTEVITHVSSALIASCISFLFSEYVNSYLLCKIKKTDKFPLSIFASLFQHFFRGNNRQLYFLLHCILWNHGEQRHTQNSLYSNSHKNVLRHFQHPARLWR